MNVLYIFNDSRYGNGANTALLRLIKGLKAFGVNPIAVFPDNEGICADLRKKGIKTIAAPYRMNIYPPLSSLKDIVLFLPRIIYHCYLNGKAVRKIFKAVSHEKIDLIHTNVSVINVGYKLSRKLHIPHIYHVREYTGKGTNFKIFPSKQTLSDSLSASESYAVFITKDLQKFHGMVDSPNSIVSYDGNDIATSSKLQYEQKEDYFLYAARIEQGKGLDMLLKAYKEYLSTEGGHCKLYVAGSTNGKKEKAFYDKLLRFVDVNGMTDDVKFLGRRNDVGELMSHARAFIIPSQSEGFGLTFAEAAVNGCLIIARYTTGIKEQIDNGKTLTGDDIALPFATTAELASLLRLASDKPESFFKPYIERAFKATTNDLYSQQKNVDNVFAFYKKILNENK